MATWHRGNTRGNYPRRGSGRGGRWTRTSREVERPPSPVLGDLLQSIKRDSLILDQGEMDQEPVGIRGCEVISSYNWLNKTEPTILVPGKPPRWTPLADSTQLQPDKGQYFRDPNAARFPPYPIEPAVRAIFETNPDFPASDIDIFGCASTIGNLLRFIRNIKDEIIPFRFLVEVVGNTVFFIRRENSPTEFIQDVRGYGFTFLETYTTWNADVKGSESHQRIVRYDFGGFDCLVKFEADGYLAEEVEPEESDELSQPSSLPTTENDLTSALGQTTMNTLGTASGQELKLIRGGRLLPHEALIEVRTRSINNRRELMPEQLPRFWVRQTPWLVFALHERGLFKKSDVNVRDVREDTSKWEAEHQNDLKKLQILLMKLVSFTKDSLDNRFEVVYRGGDELEIRKQHSDVNSVLPIDLMEKWADYIFTSGGGVESPGLEEKDDEWFSRRYPDNDSD